MKFADPPGPARPNLLVYGPEKSGKTALACSSGLNTLLFNCDLPNATRFARSKKRDPHGKVREVTIPEYTERQTPILDLMSEIVTMAAHPSNDWHPEVVVVDPISGLYGSLLEELAHRAMKPSFDHRLAVTTYIQRFAKTLCKTPGISTVLVCHAISFDKGEEGLEYMPSVGSKTASQTGLGPRLLEMVDIIAYTGVSKTDDGEKQYLAQLVQQAGRRGGDRYDCLDDGSGYRQQNLEDWFRVIEEAEEQAGVRTFEQERKAA